MRRHLALTTLAGVLAGGGLAGCGGGNSSSTNDNSLTVKLVDGRGAQVGTAVLTPVPLNGSPGTASASPSTTSANGVRFHIDVSGLAPGAHALRITAEGRCDPPDFSTSGPLLSPAGTTGVARVGHTPGTLPDLPVGDDGKGGADLVDDLVTLDRGPANSLHTPRGTALIVAAAPGDSALRGVSSGAALACGVLSAPAPVSPTPSPSPTPTPSPTPAVSTTTTTVTVTSTSTSTVVATPAPTPTPVPPTPTPALGVPTP